MDKLILKAEQIDLTGLDLKMITKGDTNIMSYHQLETAENIEEILSSENRSVIILYETQKNIGHWCSIFIRPENPRILEFFDPYGNAPDTQLKFAVYNKKNDKPYLSYLLDNWYKRGGKLIYNKFRLQKWDEDVNTCGRWSSTRILLRKYSISEFSSLFTKNQHYNPDFWVSALTYFDT